MNVFGNIYPVLRCANHCAQSLVTALPLRLLTVQAGDELLRHAVFTTNEKRAPTDTRIDTNRYQAKGAKVPRRSIWNIRGSRRGQEEAGSCHRRKIHSRA